jgi:hypothetical protein
MMSEENNQEYINSEDAITEMQHAMGYFPPTSAPLSGNFALSSKLQRA